MITVMTTRGLHASQAHDAIEEMLLLYMSADEFKNKFGKTARDYATEPEIIRLLDEAH